MAIEERVNLATNPSFESVGETPVLRENLVLNPSFNGVQGWDQTDPDTTLTSSMANPLVGTTNGVIEVDDDTPWVEIIADHMPVDPESWISGSTWVMRPAASPACFVFITIYEFDAGMSFLGGSFLPGVEIVPADTYVIVPFSGFETSPDTAFVTLGIRIGASDPTGTQLTSGETFPIDATILVNAPTQQAANDAAAEYFDGDVPPIGVSDVVVQWTGTAHDSSSVVLHEGDPYPPVARPRRFQIGGAGFEQVAGAGLGAHVDSIEDANAVFGVRSLVVAPNGTDAAQAYGLPAGQISGSMARLGLDPGSTYTLSVYVTLTAPQDGSLVPQARTMRVGFDGPGGVSHVSTPQAADAAGTERVHVTVTVPADATEAWIELWAGSDDVADWVYFDGLLIEEGSTLGAYFDGSLPPGLGFSNLWDGSPHNSTSAQILSTAPPRGGAWGVNLFQISFEGGEAIVPALLTLQTGRIVGCLTEPPDGLGLPPLRTQDANYAQRDGVQMLQDFYEPRMVTLKVTVSGADCEDCLTVKAAMRQIYRNWSRSCLTSNQLLIFPDCYDPEATGPVDPDGFVDAREVVGPFVILGRPRVLETQWVGQGSKVANLTLRFDSRDHQIFIADMVQGQGGLVPVIDHVEQIEQDTPTTLDVLGDVCTFPEITLHGPHTGPVTVSNDAGQSFTYSEDITSGEDVTVDTRVGRALSTFMGVTQDVSDALSGDLPFPMYPPGIAGGTNTLTLTAAGGTGNMTVLWRNVVIGL